MKRPRTLFVLFVFVVCLVGWLREHATQTGETASLHFPPVVAPEFEELEPPIGAETVVGRVLDADGSEVEGLEVLLSPPKRSGDAGQDDAALPLHWTTTDAQGGFHFEELEAGSYSVVLFQPGREPLRRTLEVPAEQEILWQLEKGPLAPIEGLPEVQRADLVGHVESADRPSIYGTAPGPVPREGFEVLLLPDEPDPMLLTGVARRRATVTADGTFHFDGVVAGAYHLQLLPPWARSGDWPVLDTAALEVSPDGTASPSLSLRTGTISGRLLDPEGRTIEGALVEVWPKSEPAHRWPALGTDEEGTFVIELLPPGTYTVRLHAGAATIEHTVEVLEGANRTLELERLDPRG